MVTAVIESLQLILCRGLSEWDDIIHNSLNCVIGVVLMNKLIEIQRKKNRLKTFDIYRKIAKHNKRTIEKRRD